MASYTANFTFLTNMSDAFKKSLLKNSFHNTNHGAETQRKQHPTKAAQKFRAWAYLHSMGI
jgi:type IV secretory pathway VirB6-like protein